MLVRLRQSAARSFGMAQADTFEENLPELTTFKCRECYVYAPLPPSTAIGHRAEVWNVDKWLKEVKLRVVTVDESCALKLEDKDTNELFAECPLPADGTSLTTAVEPVTDSSRYFVLRVADKATGNHAFIGLGFRERSDASNFAAALDDYRQYLRRKKEAEHMKEEYNLKESEDTVERTADFSLKPGQTIKLKLSNVSKTSSSQEFRKVNTAGVTLTIPGIPKIAPPSPATTALAAANEQDDWGDFVS